MKNFQVAVAIKISSIVSNLNKYRKNGPIDIAYDLQEEGENLWLTILHGGQKQSIPFPIPYRDDYGNYVVGKRVVRAVGTWYHKDREYTYWQLMTWLLTGRIETAFPSVSRRSQLERLILSFESSNAPMAFRSFKDLVDGIVNKLPLTGTPMETWAMCNRAVFLDPTFDSLKPAEALKYQKEANIKHFPWSSLGLSDSGMCNNNLLKVDLRKYTPFGIKHHNPMRNLYQTLGMRGDEAPVVVSKSAAELKRKQGVERRGWNLMTCFLDVPLNFEDQLIVDTRHMDKLTLESKRFICFGDVKVSPGQELSEGDVLSIEPNGKALNFWNKCDRAVVTSVEKDRVFFNGQNEEVIIIQVETKHIFKEGVKLTNCHGNKGVITFADCGTMFDQVRKTDIPIDIIVSAKTIEKRRNYGQVLEVLLTLLKGKKDQLILPDDVCISVDKLKTMLAKKGYAEDGTSKVKTPWFEGNAICGWGFWGLIKNPENQLWTKAEVLATDNQNRRKAGLKLSHIELKGLTTIFGPENPVIDEVLSHQQGVDSVYELVRTLEVIRGKSIETSVIDWSGIKPLLQSRSYFHNKNEIRGTVVDEHLAPGGFVIQLPRVIHIFNPKAEGEDTKLEVLKKGENDFESLANPDGTNIFIDKIYAPFINLRTCWEHSTGLWGLSDIGGHLNNIITACHQLNDGLVKEDQLLRAVSRYYDHVARRLSTKSGEISTYALAVRYPHSVKATATLAKEGLPKNWLEIHKDMADDLGVSNGSYVIAERFPCLGFKSLRIQRVRITEDPQCKYVIRVSGNSLVSQNLDFDGDVLFLMSFKTPEANEALEKEFQTPCKLRKEYIEEANSSKIPTTETQSLDDINITSFPPLTAERQAEIVDGLIGIKRGTGTIVALSYNLMRIIEGNIGYEDREANLAMEVILDKVANSVFSQKHAGISLEERCKKAICTANLKEMLDMNFPKIGSEKLCAIIKREARSLGIDKLDKHYENHLTKGRSNIINTIVRKKHRFYFATRASLSPVRLLRHLDAPAVDLTSQLWRKSIELKEKQYDMPNMQQQRN